MMTAVAVKSAGIADSVVQEPAGGARVGGGQEHGGRHHRARDERAREAGAPHLLHQRHHVEHGATAPAERGRDEEPRPAEGGHRLPEVMGEAARLEGERLDALGRAMLLEKGARRLDQELLLGGGREVHG